jgi:hypothetical protein
MPVALLKEVVAALGLEIEKDEDFDMEKFKEHVGKSYTRLDEKGFVADSKIVKAITGKAFGSINTKIAQEFGFKSSEVDGKTPEELLPLVKSRYETQIADLTEKATKGNDKKVEDLLKSLGEKESKLKAAEEGLKELDDKYNNDSKEWSGKLTAYKLSDKLNKTKSSIADKLIEDYHKNELVKTGFESALDATYSFELDEKDEVVVKDKKTGDIVKSKAKVGHIATPDEVILSFAEAKGVLKKNNASPAPIKKKVEGKEEGQTEVRIHPNAVKNAQRTA